MSDAAKAIAWRNAVMRMYPELRDKSLAELKQMEIAKQRRQARTIERTRQADMH